MDLYKATAALTTANGVTGHEASAADVAEKYFRMYTDDV